jgi:hypothetical protein
LATSRRIRIFQGLSNRSPITCVLFLFRTVGVQRIRVGHTRFSFTAPPLPHIVNTGSRSGRIVRAAGGGYTCADAPSAGKSLLVRGLNALAATICTPLDAPVIVAPGCGFMCLLASVLGVGTASVLGAPADATTPEENYLRWSRSRRRRP